MSFEIRACRDADEMQAYQKVLQYVFAEAERDVEEEGSQTLPEWTTCAFSSTDGLVATMGTFPFTARLNGEAVPMGGVTGVGTLPGFRRRGLLRRIMTRGFETMHERGQAFAILLASMGAIYQRFGYGNAAQRVAYRFDPRHVAFETETESPGTVTTLMAGDEALPVAKKIYVEWATPRNLPLHRVAPLWEHQTFRKPKERPVYTAVYRNAGGEPRGYLVYTTEAKRRPDPGPDQDMDVRDFCALDTESYRALWNYIRSHDLVAEVRMWNCLPEDDPAPDLLLEPRMLNRTTGDWIWMRIVDVEQALTARPYPVEGKLVIGLPEDEMCPWNACAYELETAPSGSRARVTNGEPDLVIKPNMLSGLLAGYRGATHYLRAGLLEECTPGAAARADSIFRTAYAPFCPNEF